MQQLAMDVSSAAPPPLEAVVHELQERLARSEQAREMLALELKHAKQQSVLVQQAAEREEEAIMLKLMRRLEQLKREKALLTSKVEQEEEFLTNNLQRKLDKLAMEKGQLEVQLLDLRKQMEQMEVEKARLAKEKIDLEATLESESEYIVNKLQVQLGKLASEKKHLREEKVELQRQVLDLSQSVDRLNRDKVRLEQDMEMEEESIVNRLQRQLELLLGSIRLIEGKLEAKGITMKDLGITPFEFAAPETLRIYSRSPSSASSVDKWGHGAHAGNHPHALGSSPSSGSHGAAALQFGPGRAHHHRGYMRMSAGGAGPAGPSSTSTMGLGSTSSVTAAMGAAAASAQVGGGGGGGGGGGPHAGGSISGASSMELCAANASGGGPPAAKPLFGRGGAGAV